jgi:phosphate starvation-inducible PhoH-like protein
VSEETTIQRLSTEGADMLTLAGVNDENLIELAKQTGAKIALRGETLAISGNAESVARAMPIAQRMIDTA